RGYRIGVIACNDGGGLPGSWGRGLAALWAKELTREALWDALMERRTYGVTGDRIRLAYWGNSAPMGSLLKNAQRLDVLVDVTCSDELFTIEVIHNGKVAASYCHAGGWDDAAALPGKVKLQVQWGWGPKDWYGFPREPVTWNFGLSVNRGRLASVEPRRWDFSFTQRERTDTRYAFSSVTSTQARAANFQPGSVVLELEATHETELALEGEGIRRTWKVADLLARGDVIVLWDEVYERVRKQFGLGLSDIENPDSFYHNARKVKITRAIPEAAYRVQKRFAGLPIQPGRRNYTYVRVIQRNGQVAWSSPVWVDA
ncbi:MAG: DUF3604 domain-containing protein, partial [Planctomycetes bacterium]|nr:DUF3604 domain-containing protein [Planctomycetota bacterium]